MDCPLLKNVMIHPVVEADIKAIIALSDQNMGRGYLNDRDIKDYIKDRKTQIICAKIDDVVVGLSIAFTTSNNSLQNEKSLKLLLNHFSDVNTIGAVKTIIVDENHQRKGIGTLLVKHALDFLKAEGAQACYAVALKMLGTINIGEVLDRFNFTPLKEIEDFWAFKSIEWDFICPACGEPPCRCVAVIYTLYPVEEIADPIQSICSID